MPSVPTDLLITGFERSAHDHPARPALEVGDLSLRYADLLELSRSIAATICLLAGEESEPLGGVLGNRSLSAYTGVLGTLLAGRGYVPLNIEFDVARLVAIVESTGCRSLVVGPEAYAILPGLMDRLRTPMLVIAPEERTAGGLPHVGAPHTVLGREELRPAAALPNMSSRAGNLAYIMYTSGSTGTPKGVMVGNDNARRYMQVVTEKYQSHAEDRFSQFAELTFDASVHDMFLAWEAGACLCVPGFRGLVDRPYFIASRELTVVTSVPSYLAAARRQGRLGAGSLPTVRILCFGGDALPAMLAESCCAAAPGCIVDNFYGPTELTIGCVSYHWNLASPGDHSENGVLPIGYPLPGLEMRIVDDALAPVPLGTAGELVMTGPQLTRGYWKDESRTRERYVTLPGEGDVAWYRTGDVARQRLADGPVMYLGRIDNQVQVRGARVELEEVEAIIRQRLGVEELVVAPVTGAEGTVEALELVLAGSDSAFPGVLDTIRPHLPRFMMPRTVRFVTGLPLNANGKYDRRAVTGGQGDPQTRSANA